MPNLFTLPMIAALAVGGTASGLYLGRSAIAEINPAHFAASFSPDRFHADLVPGGSGVGSASAADVQNIALTGGGYGDGCVNCRTYPEEYVPHADPATLAYFEEAPVDAILENVDRQIDEAQRSASETVERYAYYRVSDEDPQEQSSVTVHRGAPVEMASAEPAPADMAPAAESQVSVIGAELQQ